jgi:hypothetical protein
LEFKAPTSLHNQLQIIVFILRLQEARLEKEIGYGAQLEELIDEATDEMHLITLYAQEKAWERTPDDASAEEMNEDIKQGYAKEDAENARTA